MIHNQEERNIYYTKINQTELIDSFKITLINVREFIEKIGYNS